jgi:hypothetical protein
VLTQTETADLYTILFVNKHNQLKIVQLLIEFEVRATSCKFSHFPTQKIEVSQLVQRKQQEQNLLSPLVSQSCFKVVHLSSKSFDT